MPRPDPVPAPRPSIVCVGRRRDDGVWCVTLVRGAEIVAELDPPAARELARDMGAMADISEGIAW